jgi:hypothetical protein
MLLIDMNIFFFVVVVNNDANVYESIRTNLCENKDRHDKSSNYFLMPLILPNQVDVGIKRLSHSQTHASHPHPPFFSETTTKKSKTELN